MTRAAPAVALAAALLVVPLPAEAEGVTPGVSVHASAGGGGYWAESCDCVDRPAWGMDVGLSLQWLPWLAVDLDYRHGAVLGLGYFPFDGFAAGFRAWLTPDLGRFWGGAFARLGVSVVGFYHAREPVVASVYARPGWALELFPERLFLELELDLAYAWGSLAHLDFGARLGLRVVVAR